MPPAARIGDNHSCPIHDENPVSGPCSPNVLIGGSPAARLGDECSCGPPDTIARGSATVQINGKPAARMGDSTSHGGQIVMGCPTVIIGDASGGGGGGSRALMESTMSAAKALAMPFIVPSCKDNS